MIPHVLNIGYGRHLFDPENGERKRLQECAEAVSSLQYIVFSRSIHPAHAEKVSEHFSLIPTRSRFRITMILDAIVLGRRIIRSSPPGTVWCVTSQDPLGAGIAGYVLARMTGSLFVVQEHGDIFSGLYWKKESWTHRVWYPIARFLVTHADRVRAVSLRVQTHLEMLGVHHDRIRVLPVFSDVDVFKTAPVQTNIRTMYPDSSCIVLSAARFVPQKNLLLLLEGFSVLCAAHPSARLVLVGSGELLPQLEGKIHSLGLSERVRIVSWTSDVISLMKTADIYALSSNYEGWARVLVEAMASGIPAVTTEVGCVGEVFLDGVHGCVVPVGDGEAYGAALIALADNPEMRSKYGEQGILDSGRVFGGKEAYVAEWADLFGTGESM